MRIGRNVIWKGTIQGHCVLSLNDLVFSKGGVNICFQHSLFCPLNILLVENRISQNVKSLVWNEFSTQMTAHLYLGCHRYWFCPCMADRNDIKIEYSMCTSFWMCGCNKLFLMPLGWSIDTFQKQKVSRLNRIGLMSANVG